MQFFAYMGKIIPKISGAITGDAFCENFSLLRILPSYFRQLGWLGTEAKATDKKTQ